MPFDLWFSFTLASIAILAIPGPTIILIVGYALGQGRRTGFATVPGVVLGDFTAMTVSLLGAGAVLAASATLFTVLKMAGAVYLFWLGIKLWRTPVAAVPDAGGPVTRRTAWSLFANAYVVTALNPKGIVFFVAFVPQFVDARAPVFPQFVALEATFLALAALNTAAWAYAAGRLSGTFRSQPVRRFINRLGGSFLCAAGAVTAMARQ